MWQLDGSNAQLEASRLECKLDLTLPSHGLTAIRVRLNSDEPFHEIDASLFQLSLPSSNSKLEDVYVRGDDLVATYSESADYPCRIQIYWRLQSDDDCVGIQLIVSAQTSRLDSTPSMEISTRLPTVPNAVRNLALVANLNETNMCYAELADDSNVDCSTINDKQITTRLFPGSLEKGVICRARLAGYFLNASDANTQVPSLYDRFVDSELPLTT